MLNEYDPRIKEINGALREESFNDDIDAITIGCDKQMYFISTEGGSGGVRVSKMMGTEENLQILFEEYDKWRLAEEQSNLKDALSSSFKMVVSVDLWG